MRQRCTTTTTKVDASQTPFFTSVPRQPLIFFFFFNDPAPTEISPLSLHDALPIYFIDPFALLFVLCCRSWAARGLNIKRPPVRRSRLKLLRLPSASDQRQDHQDDHRADGGVDEIGRAHV